MFDFFKDTVMEYRGIDVDAVHEQEKLKKEEKKEDRVFLPKSFKRCVYVFGGIYFVGAILGIIVTRAAGLGGGSIAKAVVLMIIDAAIVAALILKTKRSEITGLALIGAFFVMLAIFYA